LFSACSASSAYFGGVLGCKLCVVHVVSFLVFEIVFLLVR